MRIALDVYNYMNEIYEELAEVNQRYYLSDKKVVLFGENIYTLHICRYLASKGVSVYKIVDNNYDKWRMNYHDAYRVESPYKIHAADDVFVIITSYQYREAMLEQLQDIGEFRQGQVYVLESDINRNRQISFPAADGKWWTPSVWEIQERQYEIFQYIKEICQKNNLRYYLWAGSVLGAVRHRSFIPWDDDIDLAMPVEDYLQLQEIMLQDKKYGIYSIFSMTEDTKAYHSTIKICDLDTKVSWNVNPLYINAHVAVDIFLLCGMPDTGEGRRDYQEELEGIRRRWFRNTGYDYGTDLYSWKEHQDCVEQYKNLLLRYPFESSRYIGRVHFTFKMCITERYNYDHPVMLWFYKGKEPVMANYEEFLREMYGDYMQLPSDYDRVPLHGRDCRFRYHQRKGNVLGGE